MKQYKITSDNLLKDNTDDAYLAPDDPIKELKVIQYLGGINATERLQEYRANTEQANRERNCAAQGSNISITGTEKAQIQRDNNIRPGSPEWFRLWFSRPYMTGEKPTGK
jgi:hypothetical protein